MEKILNQLNESQCEAVKYNEGPSLVVAGAGSGKTRVLTYKIAYLISQGMNPWNILALTFTNKAAKEMRSRIATLVGEDTARRLNMGTFHSVFSRILHIEAASIGYEPSFTIYDETDSRSLLKNIIKGMGLDDKKYKASTVHNRISMAKNHLITAEDYAMDRSALQRDFETRMPDMHNIYTAYQARLRQANAMDFDDLLVNTYLLFRDKKDILRKYEERFDFVLVDEYQDTNYAQQCIMMQLTERKAKICVVGDDAQSIYAFRGANIDNILNFQKNFPTSRLFKLERNYRSTQHIVGAANSLIKHNERQIPKDVYSENDKGDKILYKPAYSDKEEAIIVCNEIQRIKKKDNCDYNDFVILYRTNAQSRSFEEQMIKMAIPYRIYGGLSFYQRKEIKDIIAYFRMVMNPDDEEAFRRIINYPARGIGATTTQKIQDAAQANEVSLWEVICNPGHFGLDVSKGTQNKLAGFRNLISEFIAINSTTDAYELGRMIIEKSGIRNDIYSSNEPEDIARQENVQEFLGGIQDFVDIKREEGNEYEALLGNFLQEVALLTDSDRDGESTNKVSMMTIHAAKGLEFPTVFIVGLEENIFPSQMCISSKKEIEEERRLFYVAITRAEKHCILTNAKSRFRFGRMEFDSPSRFIAEIDPSLLTVDNGTGKAESYGRNSYRKDYEPNRAYIGSRMFGDEYVNFGDKMQNSRPVASQFRADVKPKITSPRKPERAVDPLSDSFKRVIAASGGRLSKVTDAMTSGGRMAPSGTALSVGNTIEHQRFGIGTVLNIEGSGENTKATVEFRNAGTKQLLLKFARYKIIG